ncbi:MAG: hypothetical protein ACTHMS_15995 [Jatrophihabitans sp.]|uniref:hypothetical protein n=1 Tax=Jatrophihabitans sp. TaxID=1932789 RepID=UPI003F7F7BE3
MIPSIDRPPFDQLRHAAEAAALARPEIDADMILEIFTEVAFLLDNGLALDGLDDHDAHAVVAALCDDLVAADPGAAVRARAEALGDGVGDLHDPAAVGGSLRIAGQLLRL